MKHFFLGLLTFLVWSVLGIGLYSYYINNISNRSRAEITQPVPEAKKLTIDDVLVLYGGNDFSIDELKKIRVIKGSDSIMFTDSILQQKLFDILNEQQSKEVLLTGFSVTGETDTLGISRSSKLKEILVDYGLNEDRISTASEILRVDMPNDVIDGAVALQVKEMSAEKWAALETVIANKVLYAGFASNTFRPDNSLQAYALELKGYLEKFPSKNVTITGHTDSIGAEEDNEWIGMQRAKNVMGYLVTHGISEERMTAVSKGESEPVAPNNTVEGQRLNRRIEIKAY